MLIGKKEILGRNYGVSYLYIYLLISFIGPLTNLYNALKIGSEGWELVAYKRFEVSLNSAENQSINENILIFSDSDCI